MTLRKIAVLSTICLFAIGLLASPALAFKGAYKVGAVFSVTGQLLFWETLKKRPLK